MQSHGRVRIPLQCLREIIDEHKGFASRICRSLVVVNMDVGVNNDGDDVVVNKVTTLTPGFFVETQMRVNIICESSRASWFVVSVFSSSLSPHASFVRALRLGP